MSTVTVPYVRAAPLVAFSSTRPTNWPAIAANPTGQTNALFANVKFVSEGPAIMPTITGGGSGNGNQGYIYTS